MPESWPDDPSEVEEGQTYDRQAVDQDSSVFRVESVSTDPLVVRGVWL